VDATPLTDSQPNSAATTKPVHVLPMPVNAPRQCGGVVMGGGQCIPRPFTLPTCTALLTCPAITRVMISPGIVIRELDGAGGETAWRMLHAKRQATPRRIAPVTNGAVAHRIIHGDGRAARAASRVPCAWALCASCMRAPSCPQLNPLATPKLLLRCAGGDGDGDGTCVPCVFHATGCAPDRCSVCNEHALTRLLQINIHGHGCRRL
jgi:hypothetical protein